MYVTYEAVRYRRTEKLTGFRSIQFLSSEQAGRGFEDSYGNLN